MADESPRFDIPAAPLRTTESGLPEHEIDADDEVAAGLPGGSTPEGEPGAPLGGQAESWAGDEPPGEDWAGDEPRSDDLPAIQPRTG